MCARFTRILEVQATFVIQSPTSTKHLHLPHLYGEAEGAVLAFEDDGPPAPVLLGPGEAHPVALHPLQQHRRLRGAGGVMGEGWVVGRGASGGPGREGKGWVMRRAVSSGVGLQERRVVVRGSSREWVVTLTSLGMNKLNMLIHCIQGGRPGNEPCVETSRKVKWLLDKLAHRSHINFYPDKLIK